MTGQGETKHTSGEIEATLRDDGAMMLNSAGDIIVVAYSLSPANAARIALTWNCHDELVAACEAALEASDHSHIRDMLRAALAKAGA